MCLRLGSADPGLVARLYCAGEIKEAARGELGVWGVKLFTPNQELAGGRRNCESGATGSIDLQEESLKS